MQKIAKRKTFRNSELPNIFDVPFRSPLYPPFPPPEPKPTSPAELARILLQGQTAEIDKAAPRKVGSAEMRPEQQIHRAVVQHLRQRGVPGVVFIHVPNGGKRKPIEAAIFKSLGVRAGASDLLLWQGDVP